MERSQKSGGDLEMVGEGSELKCKVTGLHKGQSCSLLTPESFEDAFLGHIKS